MNVSTGSFSVGATTTTLGFTQISAYNVIWFDQDPDEGSAGVREPRRPILPSAPAAAALPLEVR